MAGFAGERIKPLGRITGTYRNYIRDVPVFNPQCCHVSNPVLQVVNYIFRIYRIF